MAVYKFFSTEVITSETIPVFQDLPQCITSDYTPIKITIQRNNKKFEENIVAKDKIIFKKDQIATYEISDGKLTIKDFNAYDVTLGVPIKIQIVGVVNPNKQSVGHSGYIGIGTMDATKNMYKDYLANAAAIETTSAPGWLILNSMQ